MSKTKKTDMTVVAEDKCKSESCKKAQVRFTFCEEHYDWFKFGLITKVGKKVSDFDKKYEHFLSHQTVHTPHKKTA
jgi:hypothetical protein